MNTFCNRKWFVNSEWRNDAFVRVLQAAAIATVVSSCSTMKAQSEADITDAAISPANAEEPPDAPPVRQLSTLLSDEIKRHAQELFGIEPGRLQNVYATVSYIDEYGSERLLSLVSNPEVVQDSEKQRPVEATLFTIPTPDLGDGTIEFGEAIVVYTGSPDSQTSCGASSVGGSRYCRP